MSTPHMTVLGSGSVGLTIAASLAKAGQSVTLQMRDTAVRLVYVRDTTVTGVCDEHRVEHQHLNVSDMEQSDAQDIACGVLIVATKADQVADALKAALSK